MADQLHPASRSRDHMRRVMARGVWRRAGRSAAIAGATCGLLIGCGSDKDDARVPEGPRGAVPAVEGSVFSEGDFDEIPIFRGATPMQELTHERGTTTGSYEVETARPETVLAFYEANLPALGWEPADPVRETSTGVWRGDWLKEGRRLQIIASKLTPVEGDVTHSQLDIVLLDTTTDITVATPPPLEPEATG